MLEDEEKQCGKDDRATVIEGGVKDATMEDVTSVDVEDGAPSLDADEQDDWEDADEHDDWEDEEEDESSLEDALSFKVRTDVCSGDLCFASPWDGLFASSCDGY